MWRCFVWHMSYSMVNILPQVSPLPRSAELIYLLLTHLLSALHLSGNTPLLQCLLTENVHRVSSALPETDIYGLLLGTMTGSFLIARDTIIYSRKRLGYVSQMSSILAPVLFSISYRPLASSLANARSLFQVFQGIVCLCAIQKLYVIQLLVGNLCLYLSKKTGLISFP